MTIEGWRSSFLGYRGYLECMERPGRFEDSRYLGDKRIQVVYDLDDVTDESVAAEITGLANGPHGLAFGPDTLAEARNRGYRLRST